MKTTLSTTTKQTLRLTPQQILIATMLQANSDDLEQVIREEEQRNIAIEVEEKQPALASDDAADADDHDNDRDNDRDAAPDELRALDGSGTDGAGSIEDTYDDGTDDWGAPSGVDPASSLYASGSASTSPDDDQSRQELASSDTPFREDLKAQVRLLDLTERDRFLAQYIIDSLDDSGYLTRPLQDLTDDLYYNERYDVTTDELEAILVEIVQELEPAGIGARNLRECLLLQLQEKRGTPAARLAYQIIDQDYEEYKNKRFDAIRQRHGVGRHEFVDAYRVIEHLNPKPGGLGAVMAPEQGNGRKKPGGALHLRPEFVVHEEDGELVISINDDNVPDVRVRPDAEEHLHALQQKARPTADEKQAVRMYRDHIQKTEQFIAALRQRHETMMRVMTTIVGLQRDFFFSGDRRQLHPMVQREVAERTGVDISTVSRVCDGKAVQTDFGIILCSDLFTNALINDEGDEVSAAAVKTALYELIQAEDKQHPLSDDALATALSRRNFVIARRTVAKYREALGFPVARLRKGLLT